MNYKIEPSATFSIQNYYYSLMGICIYVVSCIKSTHCGCGHYIEGHLFKFAEKDAHPQRLKNFTWAVDLNIKYAPATILDFIFRMDSNAVPSHE